MGCSQGLLLPSGVGVLRQGGHSHLGSQDPSHCKCYSQGNLRHLSVIWGDFFSFFHRPDLSVVTDNYIMSVRCQNNHQQAIQKHLSPFQANKTKQISMNRWHRAVGRRINRFPGLTKPGWFFILPYPSWVQVSRQRYHTSVSWSTKWYQNSLQHVAS